jgi:hypothetical protein
VALCHVLYGHAFRRGESVSRGQVLGAVGEAGTVGNNGTPHVHYELHRGGDGASDPVPFSPPDGLPLEGKSLPATGAYNDYGDGTLTLVSSNAGGAAPSRENHSRGRNDNNDNRGSDNQAQRPHQAQAAVDPPPDASTSAAASPPTVAAADPPAAPSAELEQQQTSSEALVDESAASAEEPAATRTTVVQDTDSCLSVRAEPAADAEPIGCLPDGTAVEILDGPSGADGYDWYRVAPANAPGEGGWVVGDYLG